MQLTNLLNLRINAVGKSALVMRDSDQITFSLSLLFTSCFSLSSLCCWTRKETYGKMAWREVHNLSSQVVELKQQNAALRTNQGKLIKEVKRLQSLWETKEMEDCALKNEMRQILSMLSHQRTSSTEVSSYIEPHCSFK